MYVVHQNKVELRKLNPDSRIRSSGGLLLNCVGHTQGEQDPNPAGNKDNAEIMLFGYKMERRNVAYQLLTRGKQKKNGSFRIYSELSLNLPYQDCN